MRPMPWRSRSDQMLATFAVTIVWVGFLGALFELARAIWWAVSG